MDKLKDNDLRQAMQRREARRQPPAVSPDFCSRVMKQVEQETSIQKQEAKPQRRVLWLLAAAVALTVLLVLPKVADPTSSPAPKEGITAQNTPSATPDETIDSTLVCQTVTPPVEEKTITTTPKKRKRRVSNTTPSIPDTLGQNIWQSRENVERALQMLAECETTIMREEQTIRNNIVKATFDATPQPAAAQLVICDNGDYVVVDDAATPFIVEL